MKKYLLLFFSLAFLFVLSCKNSEIQKIKKQLKPYKKNVIDMHVHLACWPDLHASKDCFINERFYNYKVAGAFSKLDIFMKAFGVSKNRLSRLDGSGLIVKKLHEKVKSSQFLDSAIILALDGVYSANGEFDKKNSQIFISNNLVYNSVKPFKNLHFGSSVNPNRKDALAELERVEKNGAVLVKWIPCTMDINPSNVNHIPFYKKLIELDLPLLSHTSIERSFMESKDELCDPKLLELPLQMGVKVIAAHTATKSPRGISSAFYENLIQMAKKYPNLYVDNSSLTQLNKYNHLEYTFIPELDGRVLYGSDWPLVNTKLMGVPLVSHEYYFVGTQLEKYIESFSNEFDRDIVLKFILGMPTSTLDLTRQFFASKTSGDK